jgi:hypothetical protein
VVRHKGSKLQGGVAGETKRKELEQQELDSWTFKTHHALRTWYTRRSPAVRRTRVVPLVLKHGAQVLDPAHDFEALELLRKKRDRTGQRREG